MLTRYAQKNVAWIDLATPNTLEVRSLMQEFAIPPGIAEELLLPSFKSKVERHGDILYIILHFPSLRGVHGRAEQEIDFIIGKHFLITAHYETIDPLHSFAKAFEVSTVLGQSGTVNHGGHLFITMMQAIYLALGNECDAVHRRLQDIEEHIFNGDERKMVIELSQVGRTIHDFRQALAPHKQMLKSLEPAGIRLFGSEFSYYVHNTEDAYERIEEELENLRDSLQELRETNNSLLSTKQNEISRILTVTAFVFLPLSFINGLFQMNTHDTPIVGIPGDFWFIFGGMVAVALSCFLYFKHKGWL